jgi:hypothetical protein
MSPTMGRLTFFKAADLVHGILFLVGGGAVRPYEHRHWRTQLCEDCLIAAQRRYRLHPEKGGSFDVDVTNLGGLRGNVTPRNAVNVTAPPTADLALSFIAQPSGTAAYAERRPPDSIAPQGRDSARLQTLAWAAYSGDEHDARGALAYSSGRR